MPTFVHITSEDIAKKAKRGGIRTSRTRWPVLKGVFAMPMVPNFQISHQWLREMTRWRRGLAVGVYFNVPDTEPVLVGHYGKEPQQMTAAQAAAHIMSQSTMTGVQVVIARRISPKDILRVRSLPQLVGWRYYPEAHGKLPCGCDYCQRGGYGARKIREEYARAGG